MDQLVQSIYQITMKMCELLQEGNIEEFEKLLAQRQSIMTRVDTLRSYDLDYQYGEEEKGLLRETLRMDQHLSATLRDQLDKTHNSLVKIKQNQKMMRKYSPYSQQTSGVFFDHKN